MSDQNETKTEIQAAYQEFHEALVRLRHYQEDLLKKAVKDMQWLALKKIRKRIGIDD